MKRNTNYHSHISLCSHASGDVEDYVKEAIRHNYVEIGISDHAPIPVSWMGEKLHKSLWLSSLMSIDEFKDDYLKQLSYCIEKYPTIHILKGLEIEYVGGHLDYYKMLLSNIDYFNLGIHYFFYKGNVVNTYKKLTIDEMNGYLQTVKEAFQTNFFSCLVHPDLYLYGIDVFTKDCEEIARGIIEAAIENDVYLEINANGKQRYPRKEFWNIVKEYPEAKIIIGSDAHTVKDFHGVNVLKAINFAKELGLEVCEKMEIKKHT